MIGSVLEGTGPGLALVLLVVLVFLLALTGFVVVRRRRGDLPAPVKPESLPKPAPPMSETSTEVFETSPEVHEVAPEVAAPPRSRVRSLRDRLAGLLSRSSFTDADLDDLEEVLLRADVGSAASMQIIGNLRKSKEGTPLEQLRAELRLALGNPDRQMRIKQDGLSVWLITGVNGSGKTTTIGKLASQQAALGRSVVLAAADTFRAAADEQLEIWAERAGAHVVKHKHGADPAAVVFDGAKAALARSADLLIVDTAGRLQNKANLMEELSKVRRVLEREAGAPDEVLLVIDATTGQNGLSQARSFSEAAGVTGIALTKLDGSAKGGIVIAVQQELGIPVKMVGLGEGIADLAPFDADSFIDDLLA